MERALGSRLSALGSRLSALGSRLSALGSRLSALGSRLSALGSRLSLLMGRPVMVMGRPVMGRPVSSRPGPRIRSTGEPPPPSAAVPSARSTAFSPSTRVISSLQPAVPMCCSSPVRSARPQRNPRAARLGAAGSAALTAHSVAGPRGNLLNSLGLLFPVWRIIPDGWFFHPRQKFIARIAPPLAGPRRPISPSRHPRIAPPFPLRSDASRALPKARGAADCRPGLSLRLAQRAPPPLPARLSRLFASPPAASPGTPAPRASPRTREPSRGSSAPGPPPAARTDSPACRAPDGAQPRVRARFLLKCTLRTGLQPPGGDEAVERGSADARDPGDGGLRHAEVEEAPDLVLAAVQA